MKQSEPNPQNGTSKAALSNRLTEVLAKAPRTDRGSMMIFIIGATMVIILAAVGFVQISMLMGGSNEVRDAVDAGTLNVGKKCMLIGVNAIPVGDQGQYTDVKDEKGGFALANINRVWAKAALAAMNNQAMHAQGLSTGDSDSHIESMYSGADQISNNLAGQLTKPKNFFKYFAELSERNSVRMQSGDGKNNVEPSTGSGWEFACLDKGEESNITISGDQLPSGFKEDDSKMTKKSKDGKFRFIGYSPITIGGKDYRFVTFIPQIQPHLVSEKVFDQNKITSSPLSFWNKPIPNSFSCQGSFKGGQTNGQTQMARAFVQANPLKEFQAAFPHGFIRVKLEDNDLVWNQYPIPGEVATDTYNFFPDMKSRTFPIIGLGTIDIKAFVGNEFIPPFIPSVGKALNALNGDVTEIKQALVQRINQIKPGYKVDDLDKMLYATVINPFDKEYYIYQDGNGEIRCMNKTFAAVNGGAWLMLAQTDPDGQETEMGGDDSWPDIPNFCTWTTTSLLGWSGGAAIAFAEGKFFWTPSTGYNGCLGQMRIKRKTTVYFNAGGI